MLSRRAKLSLCQLLELQDRSNLRVLFEKHGLYNEYLQAEYGSPLMDIIQQSITDANDEQLHGFLGEIVRTTGDLRYRVYPRYRYDERWDDLIRCLLLDGYKVEDKSLLSVDPAIEGAAPVEDDLTAAIIRSELAEKEEIVRLLESSANAFRRVPPDYNACLADVRVALQTLATAIARVRVGTFSGSFDETKWGQVLAYLRTSGLITKPEEDGLSGVFSFVSPGAHIPVDASDEEMARLGRSLTVSMCYFLVKRFAQSR
jgi:hypothetical protein